MVRYPHTGYALLPNSTTDADGHRVDTAVRVALMCRFEPEYPGKNFDRKGTVYLPLSELEHFEGDFLSFEYAGRVYRVAGINRYQTHVEVWVE